MVTFTKRYESFTVGKVYCDGDCLSTDTKPVNGIANGSKLYEMDTGKRYMFDEENSTWLEVSNGGGSDGGDDELHYIYFATGDYAVGDTIESADFEEIQRRVGEGGLGLVVVSDEVVPNNYHLFLCHPAFPWLTLDRKHQLIVTDQGEITDLVDL